ncbi:rod-binding protein [Pandoraea apista]|uniref:rod-binding protein n=1 Tax=Pandoraea apista TaxID=93218 RepID=UPI000F692167|nr:rod-binding protein [Pandoraea apista]RRW88818.1 peptidoglycan hydrolase [Pandoraea apista]RRW98077.1 peptidoglycan hydrolase [Pandoraea apista]
MPKIGTFMLQTALPIDASGTVSTNANKGRGAKAIYAAEQFEALFASQIMREMRNSIREISPEGSPFRSQIGDGMMDLMSNHIAQTFAAQRAFGIADFILRQMPPESAVPGGSPA